MDGQAYSTFKVIQDQLKTMPEESKNNRDLILQRLGNQAEVYI